MKGQRIVCGSDSRRESSAVVVPKLEINRPSHKAWRPEKAEWTSAEQHEQIRDVGGLQRAPHRRPKHGKGTCSSNLFQ